MAGSPERWRKPRSPYSGNAQVSATTTAERFASEPPLVKVAMESVGNPNLAANQASVCRSISLAAAELRQFPSFELYMATSVSATTEARVTLGLYRPK